MNKEVMIGTWAWGPGFNGSKQVFGNNYDEEILRETFERAVNLGLTRWDTAAVYGMGSCEKLLGKFINGRDSIFISTKFFPDKKFREGALEKSFHESMTRLNLKSADLFWIHKPNNLTKNLQEVKPTFILGVPVIFESLYKTINKNVKKQGKEKLVGKVLKANRFTSKFGLNISQKLLKEITSVFGGRLRVMISGGAAIDPAILDFFNDLGFTAFQGYGLTETAPLVSINPDIHKKMRNSSVGHIMPGDSVKIIDKDEDGIGEICFKGPNIMMGYYKNEEETNKVLIDDWFHTGDLGYVDDENFIYITGRKKNVIITKNGKNVFPEELEYYLGKVSYVDESMVWADADEDGQDSVIVATIKPDMDEVEAVLGKKSEKVDEIEKLLWEEVDKINSKLPAYKKVVRIQVRLEEFEKNTSKKIKRFSLANKKKNN